MERYHGKLVDAPEFDANDSVKPLQLLNQDEIFFASFQKRPYYGYDSLQRTDGNLAQYSI